MKNLGRVQYRPIEDKRRAKLPLFYSGYVWALSQIKCWDMLYLFTHATAYVVISRLCVTCGYGTSKLCTTII